MHDEIYLESSVMTHCFTVGGIKNPIISHFSDYRIVILLLPESDTVPAAIT